MSIASAFLGGKKILTPHIIRYILLQNIAMKLFHLSHHMHDVCLWSMAYIALAFFGEVTGNITLLTLYIRYAYKILKPLAAT